MDHHMMWMRMPDQTWAGAAAAFVGMWTLMMVPMMLPALAAALWRWRRTSMAAAAVALGYYAVWVVVGLAVFPIGALLHEAAMTMPLFAAVVPIASGALVLLVGLAQFSCWKARQLACCREWAGDARPWRQGLRLGWHCVLCCGGLMLVLLLVGMMDIAAMLVVTAAITVERLGGARAAHAVGVVTSLTGAVMVVQAAWLG